jgi:hypothetical protein
MISGRRAAIARTVAALFLLVGALAPADRAAALSAQQASFLSLAEQGAAQARAAFKDSRHGVWNGHRNVPLSWYDERLRSPIKYPLATIWGAVPLFESLSAIASANPSAANRRALDVFAEGSHAPRDPPGARAAAAARRAPPAASAPPARVHRARARAPRAVYYGAESYWDPAMHAFAPYPGDRGRANTWFDDNSWWGIAFVDAYRVLHKSRMLRDAQSAFDFVARRGWDASGGGLWWNTDHSPEGQKSGEALAAGSLLGALLAQAWQQTAASASPAARSVQEATSRRDARTVEKFMSWGDAHFADLGGLYSRTQSDSTPMPYVAGPEIEAKELLCLRAPSPNQYCAQASRLANVAYQRFAYRLNMGPQFDAIYLHWMLVYAQQTGDGRWAPMALTFANDARANARVGSGLYLKAWDGSDMSEHQAEPNMLRTDAASVELFGWLAAYGP